MKKQLFLFLFVVVFALGPLAGVSKATDGTNHSGASATSTPNHTATGNGSTMNGTTGSNGYGMNGTNNTFRTTAADNDKDFDWGWLGLVGLLGLTGLRGRHRERT